MVERLAPRPIVACLFVLGMAAGLSAAVPLLDVWRASDLAGLDDGDAVGSWSSASNRIATAGIGFQPLFKTTATPTGGPAVRFTNSFLTVPDSPVGGKTAFSIALVFKAAKAGAAEGTQWYGKSGIIDAEQGGVTQDWGAVIDEFGRVGFGSGNPDLSIYGNGVSLVDGNYHVAVLTWGAGKQSVYMDTRTPITQSGVSTLARNNAGLALGGILSQEGGANRRFVGDLAEVRFYDKALTTAEATNVVAELRETHIVSRIKKFGATPNWIYLGQCAQLAWQVTNAFSVTLDNGVGEVPLIGSLTVCPTNTFTYTLTATLSATNPADVRVRTFTLYVDPGVPVAANNFTSTPQHTAVDITLQGADPQGSNLTYAVTALPQHGALSGTPPSLTYTPDPDFYGLDVFAFQVNDGQFDSAPGTVTIKVIPAPAPPSRILLSSTNITTGAGPGAFLAVLQAVDINEGDTHTFRLVPGFGDNAKFALEGNLLYAGPDFAAGPGSSFSIRLEAMDSAGLICQQDFTLVVADQPQPMVINEIHYNGPDNTVPDEFIELYNPAPAPVDLSQWRLSGGVAFVFPVNTIIVPRGYVVVAADPPTLLARYGVQALGPWTGGLNNDGETVTLGDVLGHAVDTVSFTPEFPWPVAANGGGASMQLVNPDLDHNLGSSWRSGTPPTPGALNVVFATNAPPNIRQVKHAPKTPASTNQVAVSCKVTDPQGVAAVSLSYQLVAPGQFLPATLPLSVAQLNNFNAAPLTNPPNPAFEAETNWITIPMRDDGLNGDEAAGDGTYTVVLPPQPNRTLVRYRITVTDTLGAARRAPFEDDPSLNFAYFVYDGVPAYGKVSGAAMQSLPVYFLLTRKADLDTCNAYNGGDQIPQFTGAVACEGRFVFNWSGAFVYDGEVYDHVHYRTQGANGRYQPGRRSYRIGFNEGRLLAARDNANQPYPNKWQTLNIAKGQSNRQTVTFSLNEMMNCFLWNKVGVPAPLTHYVHWRVVRSPQEQPDLYNGDFFGAFMVQENYDVRFLKTHHLAKGNLYKLINAPRGPTPSLDMLGQQRYQAPLAVTNGADAVNAQYKLTTDGGAAVPAVHDTASLLAYVNYPEWYRYHTICEVVRDYDFWPNANKNCAWYFEPAYGASNNFFGRLWTLPWDSTDTWGPTWNGGEDMGFNGIFPSSSGGGDSGQNAELQLQYFNTFREIRDLLIQPDQLNPVIDAFASRLAAINPADLTRWSNNLNSASSFVGLAVPGPGITNGILAYARDMKDFLFNGGNNPWWIDRNSIAAGGWAVARLDSRGADAALPTRPTVAFAGTNGFKLDSLIFRSSAFADPQGAGTFAASQWRLAEITPTYQPVADAAQIKLEWDPLWDSGELGSFVELVQVPPALVQADHVYRVRVRHKDNSGRWSHWSAPFEFRPEPADLVSALIGNLVFSEIMYNPPGQGALTGDEFEFVELKNVGAKTLDLSGLYFSSGITFSFTNGASLAPGQFFLLGRNAAALPTRYPGAVVNGIYTGKLADNGEQLALSHPQAGVILSVTYNNRAPWPVAADGFGFSLVLATPRASVYRASALRLGSPGADDPPGLFGGVVISEVLSSSTAPLVDRVELQNLSGFDTDISGWYLTDKPTYPWKYRFPPGTVLPPGGFITVDESQFNPTPGVGVSFAFSALGDSVYLFSADATGLTGYSHGFTFGGAPDGVSFGRYVNSVHEEQFVLEDQPTFGEPNSLPRVWALVFNEIQYHPPPGEDAFLELKNRGSAPWPLYDLEFPTNRWRIAGLNYVFPADVSIPGGSYLLLVSGDPAVFRVRWNVPGEVPILQFTGGLQNSGEKLELLVPDHPTTNGVPYFAIDTVRYADRAPWPVAAAGAGASLQRQDTAAFGNDPANWRAAAPTPGAEPSGGVAPAVLASPVGRTNTAGQSATFHLTAQGTAPLFYQWRVNDSVIPGATNATLVLTNLQLADAGAYSAVVFNAAGSAESVSATLAVRVPVIITRQPVGFTVRLGTNVTFTAAAFSSRPIAYQWRFNGADLPGATNDTYTLTKADVGDQGLYQVFVSDALSSELSLPARLVVLVTADIVEGPPSVIVPVGATVDLPVRVNTNATLPVFYSLRKNNGPRVLEQVLDQRAFTFTFTNIALTNAAPYYYFVTNAARSSAFYSPTGFVTVVLPPANLTVSPGADATFGVVVGTPGLPTKPPQITCQWLFNGMPLTNESTSVTFTNGSYPLLTTNTLTLPAVQPGQAGSYGVLITVITNVPIAPALFSATLNITLPDRDGDGMPDAWELAHGLNPDNPSDALTDADGDGMSNLAEYLAGTDPQDPQSYLKVELELTVGATNVVVKFGAVSPKTYSVLYQDLLNPAAPWSRLADIPGAPTNRVVRVPDPSPAATARFYRLITPQK